MPELIWKGKEDVEIIEWDSTKELARLRDTLPKLYSTLNSYYKTDIKEKTLKLDDLKAELMSLEDKVFCTNCGSQIRREQVYCDKCGKKVAEDETETVTDVTVE